ncbi:MAG: efflux RND transporter periplasmic adaptor subunit, partial [Pseudomonadota bacterium]
LVAEAAVRTAKLNLSYTRITSPIDGRASDTEVDIGNLVAGGTGAATLLTNIVSLDPIYFVFDVSERAFLKYARLDQDGSRPGSRDTPNPVYIQLADEKDWPHRGVMNFVENELGQETGTVRGRAILENTNGLLTPGLFGNVRLVGSGAYEAVLVPDNAIVADQAKKIVMRLGDENTIEPRVVETGPIIDGLRVVRSGLTAEDRIVVSGLAKVRGGAKVTPNETTIEAKPDGFDASPRQLIKTTAETQSARRPTEGSGVAGDDIMEPPARAPTK